MALRLRSSMSLTSVTLSRYMVIMRSDFDILISGEPYTALSLLLHVESGKYMSRIWNQTIETGNILEPRQFVEACKNLFCQGGPCLGCPLPTQGVTKNISCDQEFIITQTPIPRKVSKTCKKLLGARADVGTTMYKARDYRTIMPAPY